MVHHCNRCRAEYESGGFYKGQDYCSTCIVQIQQQEAVDKRIQDRIKKEEEERKKRIDGFRKLSEDNLKVKKRKQKETDDRAFDEMIARRRKGAESSGRTKARHSPYSAPVQQSRTLQIAAEAITRRQLVKRSIAKGSGGTDYLPTAGSSKPVKIEGEEKAGRKQGDELAKILLEVSQGLPVSLSVGQKSIPAKLCGKNTSPERLMMELVLATMDSKGKKIEARSEPKVAQLPPHGAVDFSVLLDLADGTARGPLSFKAHLIENAMYVDRKPLQSNIVSLTSQVKTPLDLSYVRKSAAFSQKEGTLMLCLMFDNNGESGGLLSTNSTVVFGEEGQKEKAALSRQAKIKGLEKRAKLEFTASKKAKLGALAIHLSGVDANGKPYLCQKVIKEKDDG